MKLNFQGILKNKLGQHIEVNVKVVQFKDSGSYIVYSPDLDVYGYGKTVKEARDSFALSLSEFFNYIINKGTFASEMKRLGWKKKKRKGIVYFSKPNIKEILSKNSSFLDILSNKNYSSYNITIPIPKIPA